MSGNEQTIAAALRSYFTANGFTPAQADIADAGALGNLQTESGFSPRALAVNDGGPGVDAHGIAQWEGGRWSALQSYARQTGGDPNSLRTQVGFLEYELSGSHSQTVTALAQASGPAAAADAFATDFEGNNPSSDPQREANAVTIFDQIRSGRLDTAGGTIAAQPTGGTAAATDASYSTSSSIPGLSTLESSVGGWILKGVLVAGGLGMVMLGLYRSTSPARQKAGRAAGDLAPLAAAAA